MQVRAWRFLTHRSRVVELANPTRLIVNSNNDQRPAPQLHKVIGLRYIAGIP